MKKFNSTLFVLLLWLGCYTAKAQNYTWTNMPPLSQTLYSPGQFTIGNNIYVLGGWEVSVIAIGGYPVPLDHHLYAFNTVTNTWTQKNDFPGTATYGTSGFSIGGYGFLVNGWDSTGSGHGPSTTWQYDPTNDSWTQKASFPGQTRYTTGTFVLGGRGYLTCGFSPYTNDTWCYDPIGDSWSQKASFPGSPRQGLTFFTIGTDAFVGMGTTGDGFGSYFVESDFYKYNSTTDTWSALSPFPGDAVAAPSCFVLNGEAYCVGGLSQASIYYSGNVDASNKVWKYTPTSDTWTLWGVFPDSSRFGGTFGQSATAGYIGLGAKNFYDYPLTNKFYRFGPGTAPYSCAISVSKFQMSNAVYNFQANGNFSPTAEITWNFGDGTGGSGTSVIHNYPVVGNYNVTAYINDTASSCSDSASTSVSITNINNCSVALNTSNFGTTFTLSTAVTQGAGPYTYNWSSNTDSSFHSTSPDPVVNVPLNTPTTYCVTVTDTTGCVASACRTVVDSQTFYTPCTIYLVIYPDSAVPGSYFGVLYTTGAGPLTYLWDFGDGTTSNLEFPTHTYSSPGHYTICLTVSDGSGCSFSFCDTSFYAFKYGGGPMRQFSLRSTQILGITDPTSNTQIAIYPNPANAEIRIDAAGRKVDNATIYNVEGQIVSNITSPAQNRADVKSLPAGVYFIEVKIQGVTTRAKFVKAN